MVNKNMGWTAHDWQTFSDLSKRANDLQIVCAANMLLDMNDERIARMQKEVQKKLRVMEGLEEEPCGACCTKGIYTDDTVCRACGGNGHVIR